MISRLLYHGFWNFYDCLGLLTLTGTVYALTVSGAIFGVVTLTPYLNLVLVLILLTGIIYIISVPVVAGVFHYTGKASRWQPARWRDVVHGTRNYLGVVAIVLGVWAAVEVLLLINLNLYLHMQKSADSSQMKLFLLVAMALVGWICAAWSLLLAPWLAAATAEGATSSFRGTLKRAAIAVALSPGCWLLIGLVSLALLVSVAYLRITAIFLLPVLASLAQTAFHLGRQYADFLRDAREALGAGLPLKMYKKRATELASAWEHRQPRRGFKELVRPWEY